MRKMNSKNKMILDLAPIAAFFIGYRFGDLMIATGLIMATTLACLAIHYAVERKIALSPLITGVVVTIFGGLTLLLDDESFIKIKPTLVNLLFAAILLAGVYVYRKGLLKYLLEMALQLSDDGWVQLSRRWGFFFLFLAALNEVVWRHFSTEFWVNFKVFGMLSCTIIFTLMQLPLIKRHSIEAVNPPTD